MPNGTRIRTEVERVVQLTPREQRASIQIILWNCEAHDLVQGSVLVDKYFLFICVSSPGTKSGLRKDVHYEHRVDKNTDIAQGAMRSVGGNPLLMLKRLQMMTRKMIDTFQTGTASFAPFCCNEIYEHELKRWRIRKR